jgi:uncharacterized protein (DUF3084 family)
MTDHRSRMPTEDPGDEQTDPSQILAGRLAAIQALDHELARLQAEDQHSQRHIRCAAE